MSFPIITRSEWGARPPKKTNPILDKSGGVVIHYSTRDSDLFGGHWPDCYVSVRRHQDYHMDTKGWNDIAYNFIGCRHGFTFEGRGWDHRNGANQPVNAETVSYCLDVDADDTFDIAVNTNVNLFIASAVHEHGWASRLRGHGDLGTGTPCPGANVEALMAEGKIHLPSTIPAPAPTPEAPVSAPEPASGTLALVGPPSATLRQVTAWAASHGATERFLEVATQIYGESILIGVDPIPVIVIAAHETNFGKFTGVVKPHYNNWGGLKLPTGGGDYDPGAHAKFIDDRTGARALVQHVANYAGIRPHSTERVDPRWSEAIFGDAPHLPHAGWKWSSTPEAHAAKIISFHEAIRKETA